MQYFHSWSGGKDSTAGIILDHIHGLPPSTIVFCEVMYDRKRGISGELPEHIDFVVNKAKPLFESWGFKVDIVRAETDYLDNFYRVVTRSRNGHNGQMRGFPLSGRCTIQRDMKLRPINKYFREKGLKPKDFTQYIGIAVDEKERLERLRGTNKVSLLERYGLTEQDATDLCEQYGLLSPTYAFTKRGGVLVLPKSAPFGTGPPEGTQAGPVGGIAIPGHGGRPDHERLQVQRNLRPSRTPGRTVYQE